MLLLPVYSSTYQGAYPESYMFLLELLLWFLSRFLFRILSRPLLMIISRQGLYGIEVIIYYISYPDIQVFFVIPNLGP